MTDTYFTIFSNALKYFIVIMNLVVRIFFIKLSDHMGLVKQGTKFAFIKTGVFYVVFF